MKNDNEPRSTRRHNFSRKLVQCTLFSACNHETNYKNDSLAAAVKSMYVQDGTSAFPW